MLRRTEEYPRVNEQFMAEKYRVAVFCNIHLCGHWVIDRLQEYGYVGIAVRAMVTERGSRTAPARAISRRSGSVSGRGKPPARFVWLWSRDKLLRIMAFR
jgi:hypothetical protein